ncbi:hypothetical protein Ahy_A02g009354 [Arachis hypogaea]|uniref:Uncharacterized protein n=1 Tax=Arachis hypogaea TaxID=3818 RepID=A0A445EGS4_ARAHY|nr:hypothetical protein Ahy_A02g009354 [Arachis hypogaea]
MFAPRTNLGAQPSLESVLHDKEMIHEVDKRFTRWLLDCRISFNAVMSPFFQDMLDGVAGIGPGDIDADLYGGGSSGLYATSLDSSAQEGGNEGEDGPTKANLQQVLANFDD